MKIYRKNERPYYYIVPKGMKAANTKEVSITMGHIPAGIRVLVREKIVKKITNSDKIQGYENRTNKSKKMDNRS